MTLKNEIFIKFGHDDVAYQNAMADMIKLKDPGSFADQERARRIAAGRGTESLTEFDSDFEKETRVKRKKKSRRK